jgi:hypothetical protein
MAGWLQIYPYASKQNVEHTVQKINTLAASTGCTCGKWLVFAQPHVIDSLWATIATAVLQGKLGVSAKVAPAGQKSHLICIYTYNYLDQSNVTDVRLALGTFPCPRKHSALAPVLIFD